TGYGRNEAVQVSFGNVGRIATGVASDEGTFIVIFKVDTQSYATKTITAFGIETQSPAINTFYITPEIISVVPITGTVGSCVTISGTGYGANETINVSFGITNNITSSQSSDIGTFIAAFTVDTQYYGTKTIKANGVNTQHIAENRFFITPQIVWVTPNSATVGTIVTIKGTGYGLSETVKIDFGNTSSIRSAATDWAGTFSTTFTINTQVYGDKSITATGQTTKCPAKINFFIRGAIIHISPCSATVGTMITIFGNGFGGEELVSINFGASQEIDGVVSNSNGSFNVDFEVDAQSSGSLTVWATGFNTGERDDHLFIITGITMVKPTAGPVSTVVTLSGAGYYASEYVQIDLGTAININKPMTDSNGKFYTTFTINDSQFYGIKTITAAGQLSNRMDIDWFKIIPRVYLISPSRGTIGTPIIIKGDGWEPTLNYPKAYPDTVIIEVDFGGHVWRGIDPDTGYAPITSALGTFTAVIIDADPQTGGTIAVTVLEQDNPSLKVESPFYIEGEITQIEPSIGTVGCQVIVEGRGYGNSEGVRIDFGTSYEIVHGADNKASVQGAFSTTFTIDMQPNGSTTVRATGEQSKVTMTKPFVILPNIITLSPSNGFSGMIVTIAGNGFGVSESIKIGFGTTPTIQMTTTNINGWFNTTFTVDVQAKGDVNISVLGLNSNGMATSTFCMEPGIMLVTPSSGTVGMAVTVYGAGFWPNSNVIINFGKTPVINNPSAASSMGTFCTTFVVNSQAYGTTTVIAKNYNMEHGDGAIDNDYFFIKANVATAVPVSGTVGKMVTITGAGYRYGETIDVKFGTTNKISTTVASLETGNYGNGATFATTFTVDMQSYGQVTIEAVGKTSGAKGNRTFWLSSNITLITPSIGTVGTWVSIFGNGYAASETIRIDLGTTKTITVGTTTAG
ncbi:MAG: hypothetical protein AAB296_08625, partial [Candidatus Desantisbacteria bacterium]